MMLFAEISSSTHAWRDILLLAIIQGITEFLPISSDGHIVMLATLLGRDLELADLTVILHMGTLLSIIVYYWNRIWRILLSDRRTIGLLVVGTIPAVPFGLFMHFYGKEVRESGLWAGAMLPLTGLALLWSGRHLNGKREYQSLGYGETFWIGVWQAAAIMPGLSRSGLTISSTLSRGVAPRSAAVFSFILAIPALCGAGLVEGADMLHHGGLVTPWPMLVTGAFVSFVIGLLALWVFERLLVRGQLKWFAWWCIPVGLVFFCWKLSQTKFQVPSASHFIVGAVVLMLFLAVTTCRPHAGA